MPYQPITQAGVFTNQSKNIINANFAAIEDVDVWVRPQYGNNNGNGSAIYPLGSWQNPYATMAGVSSRITPGLVIGLEGVLKEEYSTPIVNDVTIIGAASNLPRQATSGGVANGGGATWLSPTSGTGALLTVNGQAWRIQNILFNNSATAAPCIKPVTVGDPPTEADGQHLLIIGCNLTGSDDGIACPSGTNRVHIYYTTFENFSGSGDIAISAAGSIQTLYDWRIIGCTFRNNAANITAALSNSTISGCTFENGTASNINLTNGVAPNFVIGNAFNIAAADFDPAGGTTGVTGDVWSNTLTDAIETGLPAN